VGGNLKIFKFNDLNGNGAQDAGEPPLPGWSFTTTGPGDYTNTSVTDAFGLITLDDIAPGSYTMTEAVAPGWRLTTPPNPKTALVTSGQTTGLAFGNQQLGILKIFKFNDLNGNGVQDAGEPPLQGWSFTTTGPGGYSNTSITDASGLITLSNLVPGDYTSTEALPGGWRLTTPPNPKKAAVVGGQTAGLTFGNQQLGSLKIFKFEDKNWNKVKDAAEPAIPGWGFNIAGPLGYTFSGVTDASGFISLANLIPGSYTVTEIEKGGGWISTNGPDVRTIVVPPGGEGKVEFGNEILPATPASSTLGMWLMIGSLAGLMAFLMLRNKTPARRHNQ
jgi:uncharacterized surface anchored protein